MVVSLAPDLIMDYEATIEKRLSEPLSLGVMEYGMMEKQDKIEEVNRVK